jgi:hypothetical protein
MSDVINVTYKYIDGAHFFVSNDKDAAGLCVAHTDLKTAFDEVAKQLNVLFEHNHNQKGATFKPGASFETFKTWLDASTALAKGLDQSGMIMPASVQPWMYESNKAGAQ